MPASAIRPSGRRTIIVARGLFAGTQKVTIDGSMVC
jgi:hypothetical protein